jgi:hypothetical protein
LTQSKRGDKNKKKQKTEFLDELGLHLQDLKNRPTTTSKSGIVPKIDPYTIVLFLSFFASTYFSYGIPNAI